MKIIKANRRTGKTADAMRWLVESPETRAIVVPNMRQKEMILRDLLKHYGLRKEAPPVSVQTGDCIILPTDNRHGRTEPLQVYIDNLDMLLRSLFGNVVAANGTDFELELWHRESRDG